MLVMAICVSGLHLVFQYAKGNINTDWFEWIYTLSVALYRYGVHVYLLCINTHRYLL